MIVTQHDLESGKLALLPPDWRIHGTARQALAVQRRRWHNQLANHRNMRTLPSGSGLVVGADSDRGIVIERVPLCWRFRVLIFAIVPGSPSGEILTREVPADFDVVEVESSQVLASARGTQRGSGSGAAAALLALCLCLLSACVGLSAATNEARYFIAHDRLIDAMDERDIDLEQQMRRHMAELLKVICPDDPSFSACPHPAPAAPPAGSSAAQEGVR